MSDGPYRALPMSPPWKRLAAAVENENFETPTLRARLREAVLDEFREDSDAVVGALRPGGIGVGQRVDIRLTHIDAGRRISPGHGGGQLFLQTQASLLLSPSLGMRRQTES